MEAIKTDLSLLNERQREAVVSEAKRLLVLAGAGSGKTKTLLQKLIYLIEEKDASPFDILAITFTKSAANEMIDRLIISADHSGVYEQMLTDKRTSIAQKEQQRLYQRRKIKWIDGLTIRTFHSFCYRLLRNYGVNEFDNKFRIIGDEKRDEEDELSRHVAPETVFEAVHKLLIRLCDDTEFLLRLKAVYPRLHHRQKFTLNTAGQGSMPTMANTILRLTAQECVPNRNNVLPTGFTGTALPTCMSPN